MLLRIDDVVSGIKKDKKDRSTNYDEDPETFGDEREG